MKKYISILLLLLIIPLSYKVYRIYQHKKNLNDAKIYIGTKVPNLKLVTNKGEKIELAKEKGKVVVIVFWASWCKYCIKEINSINTFYENIKNNPNIKLISISIDKNSANAKKIINEKGIKYPVVFDKYNPKTKKWKYVSSFKIVGVPSIWIIDKNGIIRDLNLGTIKDAKKVIDKSLQHIILHF